MYTAIRGSLALIFLTVIALSSGCAQIQAAAYKSADAAAAYCVNNTASGRVLVREGLEPAYREKDMAICLRCPGEEQTFCTGDPKVIAQ